MKGELSLFSTPQEKEQYVHSVFTRIAGYYDTMNKLISFNQDRTWRRKAALKTGALPGHVLLDCCCGTGALTGMLVPMAGERGRVIGIDFCREMLAVARDKCPGAEFVHGNVMDLPFPDNSFDAATMGFALRNLADQNRAVQEMARVVKPGGRIVILELNRPSMPGFKQAFNFYFNYIVPFLGKLRKGSGNSYLYLPQSYAFLPPPGELLEKMKQAGIKATGMQEMTGGVTALFWGRVV